MDHFREVADSGVGCACVGQWAHGNCVFTAQFCCEPKTAGEKHMTCYQEPTLGEELQVIFFLLLFLFGPWILHVQVEGKNDEEDARVL